MGRKNIVLIITGFILISIPFFINYYSVYKLISIISGIILIEINFIIQKNRNIFAIICLPIILILITYGVDYFNNYVFNIKSIYVLENKINDNVSIYNSLFYRVFKCDNKYIIDHQYKSSFLCNGDLLDNIDINKLLGEPKESYKKNKNKFIKVTGKVSQINGTSSLYLQAYFKNADDLNGYVKFNETSKLIINLNGVDISSYRIYDYITVVGYLNNFKEENQELFLIDTKIDNNYLYDKYDIQVIESNKCNNEIIKYIDNLYTYCIDNIYLDYKVDKYELSYAFKDKKISYKDLINNAERKILEDIELYKLEKFNILSCNGKKYILVNKHTKLDYSLCKE